MTLSFYHQSSSPPRRSLGQVAAGLTKMLDAGYPIPKGFIVASETCQNFFASGRLKDKILLLLGRCDFHNPEDIARVSRTIKKLILAAEIPKEISEPLLEAALKLGKDKVMLTPSPLGETAAPERIMGLSGEAAILMGIRELWAEQFTGSELYSIQSSGEFPQMAICVQVQPQAVASGILVTSDTDKTACKITAVWGEGGYLEKLQGADHYLIARSSGQEIEKQRSLQTQAVSFLHGKTEIKSVPASRQKKQKLDTSALKSLAKLANLIQQEKFFPQQVTFVYDGKKVFLIDLKPAQAPEKIPTPVLPTSTSRRLLLKGLGMTPGIVTGMVRVVSPQLAPSGPGDILVAAKLSHLTPDLLRSAKGVIVEEDTPASAVIQLANKGIAFLMSAAGAVDLLEPGTFVTLHTPRGEVLAGGYRPFSAVEEKAPIRLATRLGTSLSLGESLRPFSHRGQIILSPDKLIEDLKIHPLKLIKERKPQVLGQTIARALNTALTHYPDNGMIYSFSRLTSKQYAQLSGGRQYESVVEENPDLGFFGSTRLLSLPQLAQIEIEAIESVRLGTYGQHVSLLLSAVRTTFEVQQWLRLLSDKLPRSASMRYLLDLSIPSLCWQLDQVASLVDGVVLDLDRIAMYLFAMDPRGESWRYQPLDLEPTLMAILQTVETATRQQGIYLILKGEILNHDPYLSFAVNRGIHELNLPPKDLPSVTQRLSVLEQERVTHV